MIRKRLGDGEYTRCYRVDHELWDEISHAREAADAKHGANSIEQQPADSDQWLRILAEEFGEVAHELTYDSGQDISRLRAELIDILSVAAAWVSAIDDASGEIAR